MSIEFKRVKALSIKEKISNSPNPGEVIDEILDYLDSSIDDLEIAVRAMEDILKKAKETIVDKDGNLLKVGLLRWGNIAKYLEFAQSVRGTINNAFQSISENNAEEVEEKE